MVTDFNKYGFAGIKKKDGKWGSINQNGEVVQEPTYDLKKRNIPEFVGKYYRVNATKFSDEI